MAFFCNVCGLSFYSCICGNTDPDDEDKEEDELDRYEEE